ncbi:MAG: LTA synthase family protein [Bacilli bacterium]|nr:LTA synthase family protein [Bacilli bacterium]
MLKKINIILGSITLYLSIFIIFLVRWALTTFGKQPVDSMLFTLFNSFSDSSTTMLNNFYKHCLIPATIIYIIIMLILFFNPLKLEIKAELKKLNEKKYTLFPFIYIKKFFFAINIVTLVIIGYISADQFGITDYIVAQATSSDFIEANYADPETTEIIFPSQKRNLIYIYMESLETTYLSNTLGGYQSTNLMPKLTELTSGQTNFSNTDLLGGAVSSSGSTWTIAGMVSTTAGIPLKVDVDGNSYGSEDDFLPGAYNLGDILEKEGYNQMIMMGSDSLFAGRKYYFTLHGNYDIFDYYTAISEGKISSSYKVWWGYEDSKLYEYAKEKLAVLASEDEPFNFTLLTADTHFPDGYLSEYCSYSNKYDDNLSNVVVCADDMLYDFISWIKEQDFYDNTTIVISGDHISMDQNFFKDVSDDYTRTVYNLFINSAVTTENNKNRNFTTLDMFPTTLASLGVIIDGDKLGLGTNLFSDKQTLTEQYGIDYINQELDKSSDFYKENILK